MSETRNPFEYPLSYIVINRTLDVCRLVYDHPDGASILLSATQAEYAARAINNYESLVYFARLGQRSRRENGAWKYTKCIECGGVDTCRSDCPLAALLAEEKTEEDDHN